MSEVQPEYDPIMRIQILRDQRIIDCRFGKQDSPGSQRMIDSIHSIAEEAGFDENDLFEIIFEPEGWQDRLKNKEEQ